MKSGFITSLILFIISVIICIELAIGGESFGSIFFGLVSFILFIVVICTGVSASKEEAKKREEEERKAAQRRKEEKFANSPITMEIVQMLKQDMPEIVEKIKSNEAECRRQNAKIINFSEEIFRSYIFAERNVNGVGHTQGYISSSFSKRRYELGDKWLKPLDEGETEAFCRAILELLRKEILKAYPVDMDGKKYTLELYWCSYRDNGYIFSTVNSQYKPEHYNDW